MNNSRGTPLPLEIYTYTAVSFFPPRYRKSWEFVASCAFVSLSELEEFVKSTFLENKCVPLKSND